MTTPSVLDRFMHWAFVEVPQVVQMLGGIVILVVVVVVAVLVWWKHRAILAWWPTRSPHFKAGVCAGIGAVFVIALIMGSWIWDFVQHDNQFCNSCHVMEGAFERFSESGHAELSCHDCHQQSTLASLNQLNQWVLNRPTEVGEHAPVSTETCAGCHINIDADSTWTQIGSTAGHVVHLEADTADLADVMCVTCHGAAVHEFVPAQQTCGQSGCHGEDKTEIVLGDMAGQTVFHCISCHDFTAEAPGHAALDTLRSPLSPTAEKCLGCHEMQTALIDLVAEDEPHDAVCGTCHNAHTQESPEAARETCIACHQPADSLTAFHRGLDDAVVENCVGCHQSHTFVVSGEDCLACHADVLGGVPTAGPLRPVSQPDDAAHQTSIDVVKPTIHPVSSVDLGASGLSSSFVRMYVDLRQDGATRGAFQAQAQQAGFNHADHEEMECTDCHSMERQHGEVTVTSRAECSVCHHRPSVVRAGCSQCHATGGLGGPISVSRLIQLGAWDEPRERRMAFDHDVHEDTACATCHISGTALVADADCASCHVDHHDADTNCLSCHIEPPESSHPTEIHARGCAGSGCHESEEATYFVTSRVSCLVCHVEQVDHEPDGDCAQCHKVSMGLATRGDAR